MQVELLNNTATGIVYGKTNQENRDTIMPYHCSPAPLAHHITAHKVDVKSLPANNIVVNRGLYRSMFTVGFEIEKNAFSSRFVEEYPLLKGFEKDGSCGYEAITHILPLLPASSWRNKVFNMFTEAKYVINDTFSPSNHLCGGHTTVTANGYTANELLELTRKNTGLIYAMFRYRLTNGYCNGNLNLKEHYSSDMLNARGNNFYKYRTVLAKAFSDGTEGLEFRLVPRFTSVKQLMRRYELFYELVNFSVNHRDKSFKQFLKHVKPLIMLIYDQDEQKVKHVYKLAEDFQHFINTDEVRSSISQFILL